MGWTLFFCNRNFFPPKVDGLFFPLPPPVPPFLLDSSLGIAGLVVPQVWTPGARVRTLASRGPSLPLPWTPPGTVSTFSQPLILYLWGPIIGPGLSPLVRTRSQTLTSTNSPPHTPFFYLTFALPAPTHAE